LDPTGIAFPDICGSWFSVAVTLGLCQSAIVPVHAQDNTRQIKEWLSKPLAINKAVSENTEK
jgi:hypothetical protein